MLLKIGYLSGRSLGYTAIKAAIANPVKLLRTE